MLHVLVFLSLAASSPIAAPDAVDSWTAERAAKACEGDKSIAACHILARIRGDDVVVELCRRGSSAACTMLADALPSRPPSTRAPVVDVVRESCSGRCVAAIVQWSDDAFAAADLAPFRAYAIDACRARMTDGCLSTAWTGPDRVLLRDAVVGELRQRCATAPARIGQATQPAIVREAAVADDPVEQERLSSLDGVIDGTEACALLRETHQFTTLQGAGLEQKKVRDEIAQHNERRCKQEPGLRACALWLDELAPAQARAARQEICTAKPHFCPPPTSDAWGAVMEATGEVRVDDYAIVDIDVSNNHRVDAVLGALCDTGHAPACAARAAWNEPSPPLPSLTPPATSVWDGRQCFVDRRTHVDAYDFGAFDRTGDFVEVTAVGANGKMSRTLLLVHADERPLLQWCTTAAAMPLIRLRVLARSATSHVLKAAPSPPAPSSCDDGDVVGDFFTSTAAPEPCLPNLGVRGWPRGSRSRADGRDRHCQFSPEFSRRLHSGGGESTTLARAG